MTNSIDLIPNGYREAILRNRRFTLTLWTALAICIVVAAGSYFLAQVTREMKAQSDVVRQKHALSTLYGDQIEALDLRLKELDEEWAVLSGLRTGAAAVDLFVIIDQALPGEDVWFTDWKFRRAGVVKTDTEKTTNTGYFIVVTSDVENQTQPEWRVETHMDISGQAKDHAALSRFVRGLYKQGEIQDVKLSQTKVTKYANRNVVDFKLAVVLYSEPAA